MQPAGGDLKGPEQHRADQPQPQPQPAGQGARHLDRGEEEGPHVQVGIEYNIQRGCYATRATGVVQLSRV